MPKIYSLDCRPILDSRGEWTIEVNIKLDNGLSGNSSAPQGKSLGSYEAIYAKPEVAVLNVKKIIEPALRGLNPLNQKEIDETLIKLDGTANKSKLGANAILAVSVACARISALAKGIPLWQYLRDIAGLKTSKTKKPRLYINVINGGMHSGNNLDFQEYLIIPKSENFRESAEIGIKIYQKLKTYLEDNFGANSSGLGDEGGFAPDFKNNLEPFEILDKVSKTVNLRDKIDFGLDAAASNVKITAAELTLIYEELKSKFKISYIEDPYNENDFKNFAALAEKLGGNTIIAGDDLTATNFSRMQKAKEEKSVNGIIIKPNQIGTVTETLRAIKTANEFDWKVIVSHRSGETNDDFIADLAYGTCADGIKLGAPARGERVAKYNRLLEIARPPKTSSFGEVGRESQK